MRKELLNKLLQMHQGASKMKRRARLSIYWPFLDSEIEQHCATCSSCQSCLSSQTREPMVKGRRPQRPFQELHVDLFEFAGQKFLACIDGYSGWITLDAFGKYATARHVIDALRRRFVEKSVPEFLFSDNGPQFVNSQMAEFLRKWGVTHQTSSPGYAQSNGTAEAAVKQLKKMVKGNWNHQKGDLDWDPFCEGLVMYYNTPRYDGTSPAKLLFGRNIRDTLPAHHRFFRKDVQEYLDQMEDKSNDVRRKAAEQYDAHSRRLPPLQLCDHVVMQDNRTGEWSKSGVVVEIGRHRDYLVKLPSGRIFRRNRKFLRRKSLDRSPDHISLTQRFDQADPQVPTGYQTTRYGRRSIPDRLQIDPRKKSYSD